MTLDLDFADIRTYPPADYPGIIVVRPAEPDRERVLRLIARILRVLREESLEQRLWIVAEDRVRIRRSDDPAVERIGEPTKRIAVAACRRDGWSACTAILTLGIGSPRAYVDMLTDRTQTVQLVSTGIAIVGGGIALFRTFRDRRRQRFREQHQTLLALLGQPDQNQHDLLIESAFRAAFDAAVTVSVARFLLGHCFSLLDIERYCEIREYLTWEEQRETFGFRKRRHRRHWVRWVIVVLWLFGYGFLVTLAIFGLGPLNANLLAQASVYLVLIVLAIYCLRRGAQLYWADRFIRDSRIRSRSRVPRVAA